MKFSQQLTYDASPDKVHAMLGDAAFRERVCEELHAHDIKVTVDPTGAGHRVVIDQSQPAHGIPSFAKKFVGDEIHIRQTEDWTSTTGATFDVAIPGKPGQLKGLVRLEGDAGRTTETVEGEIKVSVPLIGGKLEGMIGDMLSRALRIEERVGRRWLAGER